MAAASTRVDAGLLARVLPEGSVRQIGRLFDLMKIAEEEILAAKRACPRKAKTIDTAFRYAQPFALVGYGDELYRAHVREIISRLKMGEPLSPGTDAEVLVAFSLASLQAPLASEFAHAMSTVFARCFPGSRLESAGSEAWPGRSREIVEELRRKLARDRDCQRAAP